MVKIGNFIKKHRLKLQFTLDILANKTGLSQGFLSRIENGEYDNMGLSLDTIIKLANGLEISTKTLLSGINIIEDGETQALPPLKTYLRQKYGHVNENKLQTIEEIIDSLTR